MRDDLWERENELAALDAALDLDDGAGRLVVVEGPAGIGKSRLLLAARSVAAERGLPVIAARGMELERDVPFGVARQLFVPSLLDASPAGRARLVAGPAALAAPLLDGASADLPVGEGQSGALIEGLHWLAVNLTRSAESPGLVVVVDDPQWADLPSLRFLHHTAAQRKESGICVFVGIRTGEPDEPRDLIARLRGQSGDLRLQPAALTEHAVAAVVRATGFPNAAAQFCRACAHATGGNPFLLRELLGVLRADDVVPDVDAAKQVGDLLPDSVLDAVVVNLARLGKGAAHLASAVAVLGQASVPLAAALAELDLPDAERDADVLIGANVLKSGEPLTFVHPLIAAAVLADLAPLARARAHRRAATLLDRDGADVSRVAVHLLNARPGADAWVSSSLRAAGHEALVQDESRLAVRLLRRALDEPPPQVERDATLVELAHAEAADDSPDAVARLVQALERVTDPFQRADAYGKLARLLFYKGKIAEAAQAAELGLAEAVDDARLTGHLVSAQLTAATLIPSLRATVTDRLNPYMDDARAGRLPQDPIICAHLAARMAVSGEPADLVRPVVERAFTRHPLVDETAHGVVLARPMIAFICIDEIDRAVAALEDALRSPRAQVSLITQTVAHHWWSVAAYRRGDLIDALAHANRALTACHADEWDLYRSWIAGSLAQIHLDSGDTAAARAALDAQDDTAADPVSRCLKLEARARLAMTDDDPARALDMLTRAGDLLDRMNLHSPGFISWRSSAAVAAARLGQHERSTRLVQAELRLARRANTPRSVGLALRAAGLATQRGDSIALLRRSVDSLRCSAAALELAKSLVELGAALRRAGQRLAAGPPLREALDMATRSGAVPLAARAQDELHATGSRPRRSRTTGVDSLTPTERRIAELAAAGRTNSRIAHDLYVTPKTVEWHLANVYRKLAVGGRRDLPAAFESVHAHEPVDQKAAIQR